MKTDDDDSTIEGAAVLPAADRAEYCAHQPMAGPAEPHSSYAADRHVGRMPPR
jgi:hypothetical protein